MGWEWRVFWRVRRGGGPDTAESGDDREVSGGAGGDEGTGGGAGSSAAHAETLPAGSVEELDKFLAANGSGLFRVSGTILREERRDIYYVADDATGLKHRSGRADLEVKTRTSTAKLDGLEKWTKTRVRGASADARIASLTAKSAKAPMRLLVSKRRATGSIGSCAVEVTELEVAEEGAARALQHWRSVCVEGGDKSGIKAVAKRMLATPGLIPEDHVAVGFPGWCVHVASMDSA